MEAKPFHLNFDDLPWGRYSHGRFGSEDKEITDGMSARKLSCVLTRLAPGEVSCPYHFHRMGEELFIILEGTGTLRYNGETRPLKPHDVITCPPGPGSAHQFINDSEGPLVYYAISTRERFEMVEYPDSGKVLTRARNDADRAVYLFKQEAGRVDYYEGES
ncbi:MAG TPA: cupin domain-containing protein [Oscillatoriaceae cyanobacterium]